MGAVLGLGCACLMPRRQFFSYYFMINYSWGFVVTRFFVFLFPARPFGIARSRRGQISAGAPCAPKKEKDRKMLPMEFLRSVLWTFLAKGITNAFRHASPISKGRARALLGLSHHIGGAGGRAGKQTGGLAGRWAGRQPSGRTGGRASRKIGRAFGRASGQTGRRAGRWAGRQPSGLAGRRERTGR